MTSVNGVPLFSCSLCLQGYTAGPSGCVPCQLGCLICNFNSLNTCIQCAPGYLLSVTKSCTISNNCPSNCANCSTTFGCNSCIEGYCLTQDRLCQQKCLSPCSTCQINSISSCISCLAGYFLSGTSCLPDISCS